MLPLDPFTLLHIYQDSVCPSPIYDWQAARALWQKFESQKICVPRSCFPTYATKADRELGEKQERILKEFYPDDNLRVVEMY